MIIRVTEETARIGFRLRDWKNSRILADWRNMSLVVQPGQLDQPCCSYMGSPVIMHGYWPGIPTEVDIANPPKPDFPAMVMPAFDIGEDCTVVFVLPKEFHNLPHGRYTGLLRYHPKGVVRVANLNQQAEEKRDPFDWVPPPYWSGAAGCCPPPDKPHCAPPHQPKGHVQVLGTFDIDYGQRLDEHIVDLVTVEYALNHCYEEC